MWTDGERSVEQVVSDLQSQFQEIKARYAKNPSWQSRSNKQIRTLLYTALATEYPDYHTATEIDCGLPDDNSCCERFVSLLNRIKSKCRSRLSIKLANWLMLIAANGPKAGEVDWLAILELWKSNSARGRYDRAWRVDQTPVADELQNDFDAAAE